MKTKRIPGYGHARRAGKKHTFYRYVAGVLFVRRMPTRIALQEWKKGTHWQNHA